MQENNKGKGLSFAGTASTEQERNITYITWYDVCDSCKSLL